MNITMETIIMKSIPIVKTNRKIGVNDNSMTNSFRSSFATCAREEPRTVARDPAAIAAASRGMSAGSTPSLSHLNLGFSLFRVLLQSERNRKSRYLHEEQLCRLRESLFVPYSEARFPCDRSPPSHRSRCGTSDYQGQCARPGASMTFDDGWLVISKGALVLLMKKPMQLPSGVGFVQRRTKGIGLKALVRF
jgi:hypothetical protein